MLMRLLLSAIQLTASPCLLQSTLHCQKLSLYNSAPSRNHRGREHFCSVSEIGLGTGEMWVESFLSQNGCVTLVLALAQHVSPLPLLVPSIQSASVPSLKPKKDSDFTLLHRAVVPVPYTALLPHTVPLCRSWGTYFILKMAVNQEQKPCAERRQEDLTSVCAPIFLLPPPKVWETRLASMNPHRYD